MPEEMMTQLMGQEPIHTPRGIIYAQLDRLAPADVEALHRIALQHNSYMPHPGRLRCTVSFRFIGRLLHLICVDAGAASHDDQRQPEENQPPHLESCIVTV